MSTSTTSSNRFSLVENWDTETLIIFLRDLDINLDEDDFKILRRQKIDGQIFSDMTERNSAHIIFYNTLYIFCDDPNISQEILEVVRNLLLNKKVCIFHFTGSNTHFLDMVC